MIGVSHISVAAYRGGGGAPAVNPNFVSTWDTTKAGSASNTVILPLLSGGTYNGTIDWGDGNTSALSYANRTHVYASSGTYTITISGTDIRGFQFNNGGDKSKLITIENWGNLTLTTTAAFFGCNELTHINATDAPIITTTSFFRMFHGCVKLTNGNLNLWDVSSVTNFEDCFYNNNLFNGQVDQWNVSNPSTVRSCFFNCTVFNSPLTNWSLVGTNCIGLFSLCAAFNQPVDHLGFSTTTIPSFQGCLSFNQSVNSVVTVAPTNLYRFLYNCDSFDQNLATFQIDKVNVGLEFMALATGLSTANYDATLVGWEATLQAAWPGGVGYPYTININFGGSKYTSAGAGGTARALLISIFGWTITDGGGV